METPLMQIQATDSYIQWAWEAKDRAQSEVHDRLADSLSVHARCPILFDFLLGAPSSGL